MAMAPVSLFSLILSDCITNRDTCVHIHLNVLQEWTMSCEHAVYILHIIHVHKNMSEYCYMI